MFAGRHVLSAVYQEQLLHVLLNFLLNCEFLFNNTSTVVRVLTRNHCVRYSHFVHPVLLLCSVHLLLSHYMRGWLFRIEHVLTDSINRECLLLSSSIFVVTSGACLFLELPFKIFNCQLHSNAVIFVLIFLGIKYRLIFLDGLVYYVLEREAISSLVLQQLLCCPLALIPSL